MSGPHDLFARFTFGHPERAAAELRALLPPEVVERVDWSTLHREPSSVVDPELRERQSDLLFSAQLHGGQPLLLYFLLEHQSSVDRWMAFRMLRYVVRQLEHWLQQHPDSAVLPVIVPVVMYHGSESGWTAARRVEELFHLPTKARERWQVLVPRFEYLVDDLTAEREEALRARAGPPLVPLTLLLLRFGRSEKLAVMLENWKALLAQVLASSGGKQELHAVLHYLVRVGDEAAQERIVRVLQSVASEQRPEEWMTTIAEGWFEKGWVKGRVRTRAEDVLRILLKRGFAVDDGTRQRILGCTDLETLDQWFDRALTVTHLSELLGNS